MLAAEKFPQHLHNTNSLDVDCMITFAVNQFPAEEARRALGDRIQLTENQVQVAFIALIAMSVTTV